MDVDSKTNQQETPREMPEPGVQKRDELRRIEGNEEDFPVFQMRLRRG